MESAFSLILHGLLLDDKWTEMPKTPQRTKMDLVAKKHIKILIQSLVSVYVCSLVQCARRKRKTTADTSLSTRCLSHCKWYVSKSTNHSWSCFYHSLILSMTAMGAFPSTCNLTWQTEHPASISNKIEAIWNLPQQGKTTLYKNHQKGFRIVNSSLECERLFDPV